MAASSAGFRFCGSTFSRRAATGRRSGVCDVMAAPSCEPSPVPLRKWNRNRNSPIPVAPMVINLVALSR